MTLQVICLNKPISIFFAIVALVLPLGNIKSGEWLTPVTISDTLSSFTTTPPPNISVARDTGLAVAIWENRVLTNYVVQASTLPLGGAWSKPVDITTVSTISAVPQVVTDRNGNTVAAWTSNSTAEIAYLPVGGSWTAPVVISGEEIVQSLRGLTMDACGNAVATWIATVASEARIQASTLQAGSTTWSAPVNLSAAGQNAGGVTVNINNGKATAIWEREDGSEIVAQASSLVIGGDWSAPVTISESGGSVFNPQVAVDPMGNATAVWRYHDGSIGRTQAVRKLFGVGWSVPVFISSDGEAAESAKVSVDGSGNSIAIWNVLASNLIQMSSFPFGGGSWLTPVDLNTGLTAAGSGVISMNCFGDTFILWIEEVDSIPHIMAVDFRFGETPQEATDITPTTLEATKVNVDSDAAGNAVAIFEDFLGGGETVITGSSFINDVQPPLNFCGKQILNRLPTQGDLVNRLFWDINPIGNTSKFYLIFRDNLEGSPIGCTLASQLPQEFDDHNRKKRSITTYYIIAQDCYGNQSNPVSARAPCSSNTSCNASD
jgi:hypothetical protein